ncbi:PLP-dependent aminotransferase family protein [Pseudomonas sp. F1_0610]|uniref:MocR-like pyridoxine biosynthesis transcription factor PdxR n=1 Tax=Pseudomonas sp. F1_0610 TaxID=3114284 RepID=UPI0039C3848C
MFNQPQLDSVKAWLSHPDYANYPLYLRIQRAIRQLILDSALQPTQALPATRTLARSLEVSRDTVENAYSLLHAEGYIERRAGSGSFVAAMPQLKKAKINAANRQLEKPQLSRRAQHLLTNEGVREATQPVPFAPGVPEVRLFPLSLWERLERQVIKELGTSCLQHSDAQGVFVLRQAIANYVNLERGAHATPEQVLILTSSQQAISLCAQLLFDEKDIIACENPMYVGAQKAFLAAGLQLKPINVDEQGVQLESLFQEPRHNVKGIFLTPSHQYPTGTTLSLERRLALIEWAQQHKAWIIEDDYDSEFHYIGKPTACVQGLDPYQRTIYIGTFTKSLFPGLRIGYMILPPALVTPMTSARTLQDGHTATLSQLTLARFIENGHFGAYIRQMRQVYAKRLECLQQLIRNHLADYFIAAKPQGGMQIFCQLKQATNEQLILALARISKLKLTPISSLYITEHKCSGFLLGFAAYTPRELEVAVNTLAKICKTLSTPS